MIDGLEVAGQCVVVALVITTDGTKVPVGLWLGDTENKTVVTALLADLVARGLSSRPGHLVRPRRGQGPGGRGEEGVRRPGRRPTLHPAQAPEYRGHLPKELGRPSTNGSPPSSPTPTPTGASLPPGVWPPSSRPTTPTPPASLREGLDDMFTVRRLGITGALARTLTNTNCIESMISIARRTTGRVTRWKDGSMKKRWVAAGMLEAERSFRRVRGHKDMAKLVDALRRQSHPSAGRTPTEYDQAAA